MSTTANTTHGTTVEPTPTNDKLARLAVEAGKYLGLQAGDPIPKSEVRAQAKANGYTDRETRDLLGDLPSTIEVPEQGDLFGDLWVGVSTPSTLTPNLDPFDLPDEYLTEPTSGTLVADTPVSTIQQFTDYCSDNRYEWQSVERYNHTFNESTARKRYGRVKNVDRYFDKEYDTYSTVILTYCIDDSKADIAQQAEAFYPRAVGRKRRDILKELGVYDSYAGVSVLAPKYRSDGTLSTHAHSFYLIPGEVSAEDFHPLIEKHVEKVEGATVDQHTTSNNRVTGASVTVEHWGSSEQHCEPLPQEPKDVKRGATSSLPSEVGDNLPWLKHPYADYVKEWSAAMWQGKDENTIARWRPMGKPSRFNQIADEMRYYSELREAQFAAEAIRGLLVADAPSTN